MNLIFWIVILFRADRLPEVDADYAYKYQGSE
ncbi:hypothetical protein GGR01_002302 [Acetobacter oeni]|nr:hypothetical protein [Acetobacter oeni]